MACCEKSISFEMNSLDSFIVKEGEEEKKRILSLTINVIINLKLFSPDYALSIALIITWEEKKFFINMQCRSGIYFLLYHLFSCFEEKRKKNDCSKEFLIKWAWSLFVHWMISHFAVNNNFLTWCVILYLSEWED